jgi:DHA1 family multidrug resistance protein-like MFS transporter
MTQHTASDAVPSDPLWRRNLVILWGAEFAAVAGMSTVIPFIPGYVQRLGVTSETALTLWSGFIVAANFASAAVMSPVWGSLADRYGRKVMVVRALLGLSVACGLMALAQTPWQLLLARLLQGAFGGSVAAANALVASTAPRDRLGSSLGSLQAAFLSGACIGPAAGGLLADRLGYRAAFLLAAGLCLLATILVVVGVRERFVPAPAPERLSFVQNMRILAQSQTLRVLFLSLIVFQFALMLLNPLLPIYVEQLARNTKHIATLVGLVFAVPGIATAISAPLWGRHGDRSSTHGLLPWVFVGVGACYMPAAIVGTVWQFIAVRAAIGLFAGGTLPTVNATATRAASHHQTASALSFIVMAQLLGNVSGPVVGGALATLVDIRPIFFLASLLCTLAAAIAVGLAGAVQRSSAPALGSSTEAAGE